MNLESNIDQYNVNSTMMETLLIQNRSMIYIYIYIYNNIY